MPADRPITDSQKTHPAVIGCLRVFFGIFFFAGCILVWSMLALPSLQLLRARWWEQVPCVITASRVDSHSGGDSPTYWADLRYAYRHGGHPYTGARLNFFDHVRSSNRRSAEAAAKSYPVGRRTFCFVNPSRPEMAVLDRDPQPALFFGLLGVPFLAVGLLVFLPAKFFGKRGAAAGPIETGWRVTPTALPALPTGESAGGLVELSARETPRTKLVKALLFAVFWNAVVIILGVTAQRAYQRGQPRDGLTGAFLVCALIDLGVIYALVQQYRQYRRPPLRVFANGAALPLGSKLELQWQLGGPSLAFNQLRFRLEGREEATYMRGTDRQTDRRVFYNKVIVEESDPAAILEGSGSATIPAHLMHSFDARYNKVIWTLRLTADTPDFTSTKEEYPLVILPRPL